MSVTTSADRAREALRNFDALPDAAFVRLRTVCALFGVSSATVWRRAASGDLPAPIRIGKRCTLWQVGALRESLRAIITR
jgi:predicted DNA-binding transcriptional regulator AlpA